MTNPKRVTILRGLPGCGKSTIARRLVAENPGQVSVVSADEFFVKLGNGVYRHDPSLVGEAHSECFRTFLSALRIEVPHIVVDNTNTMVFEMAPYMLGAAAHGYEAKIICVRIDVATSVERNAHGAPREVVEALQYALDSEKLPPWWDVTILDGSTMV